MIIRDRMIQNRTLADKYTGFRMLSVMEFGHLDDGLDIEKAIVSAALVVFQASNADIVELVTSSPSIETTARSCGFIPLGAGMSFKFMCPSQSPLSGIQTTIADWHLSHYCGDAFGFE
jgi:hypothetical protein